MSIESDYSRARKNLRERIRYWERRYGFKYQLPTIPGIITEESVQELNAIKYKDLTDISDIQVQYVSKHNLSLSQVQGYGYRGAPLVEYFQSNPQLLTARLAETFPELNELYREQQNSNYSFDEYFNPPSEDDYYSGNDSPTVTDIERTKNPVIEENLIDDFIEDLIARLTEYDDYLPFRINSKTGKEYVKTEELDKNMAQAYADLIVNNIRYAYQRHPSKEDFYNYLRDPYISSRLQEAAHRIYADSDPMHTNNRDIQLREIIEILNGAPISDDEWDEVQQGDTGVYDFGFDSFELEEE